VTDLKHNSILVAIADETQRQLVGWIVAEMNLSLRFVPSWRGALLATTGTPSCIIDDLDDAGDNTGAVAALHRSWGGTVPLIVLSRQPDVADKPTPLGAVAGLRKPINVSPLMSVGERSAAQSS
jgi:hypothetical protein